MSTLQLSLQLRPTAHLDTLLRILRRMTRSRIFFVISRGLICCLNCVHLHMWSHVGRKCACATVSRFPNVISSSKFQAALFFSHRNPLLQLLLCVPSRNRAWDTVQRLNSKRLKLKTSTISNYVERLQ